MNIHIAGGVGEHGRNCIYVAGLQDAFLVDCGLMHGADQPYPRLSAEQIASAQWLLLTHSHGDHAGAIPWLMEQGFTGQVVLSEPTLEQLDFPVENPLCIRPGEDMRLSEHLLVRSGRSGHCIGALWYEVDVDDRRLLFSGDYTEDTLLYAVDKLRGRTADIAFLDSARDSALGSAEVLMARTLKLVSDTVGSGRAVVLPVPRHGRGLELMQLLHGIGHFRLDEDSQAARDVMVAISRFPETVAHAAEHREPHLLAQYLRELAGAFHVWYNTEQFLVDDAAVRDARVALAFAARQVLANGLGMLGVSAPQSM